MFSFCMKEEVLRGVVRVPCGERDQAGEDPEEGYALDSNILDLILVDALDPNICLRDSRDWRRCEEDEKEYERAGEAYD